MKILKPVFFVLACLFAVYQTNVLAEPAPAPAPADDTTHPTPAAGPITPMPLSFLLRRLQRTVEQTVASQPQSRRTPSHSVNFPNEMDTALTAIQNCMTATENRRVSRNSTNIAVIRRDINSALSFEKCIINGISPMAQKILDIYSPLDRDGVCRVRPKKIRFPRRASC